MKKKAQNAPNFWRAYPVGTLVKVNSHEKLRTSTIPLGTMGLVIGGCPNPWYNQVQLEDGRVFDLFCADLAQVEE
jgi:hypothetical protein